MLGKTFGPIHIFFLGKCDSTELVSNDLAAYVKFEFLLLGPLNVYLYGLEVGSTEDTELSIPGEIMIGITLGTYDCTKLGLSMCFSATYWKF